MVDMGRVQMDTDSLSWIENLIVAAPLSRRISLKGGCSPCRAVCSMASHTCVSIEALLVDISLAIIQNEILVENEKLRTSIKLCSNFVGFVTSLMAAM